MPTGQAGDTTATADSSFTLPAEHRRRLLKKEYTALRFGYDTGAAGDGLPDGCEQGAVYVLVWSPAQRSAVDGIVIDIPRQPICWLTITKVGRHKTGDWLVRYDVTDRREPVRFLARGSGYTSSRFMAIDDLEVAPPDHWMSRRCREASERDHKQRVDTLPERNRQMWRAKRGRKVSRSVEMAA